MANARLVLLSLPDPKAAAAVCQQVRVLAASVPIIVRCSYNRAEASLRSAGATDVVLEEEAVGLVLGRAVAERLEQPPV